MFRLIRAYTLYAFVIIQQNGRSKSSPCGYESCHPTEMCKIGPNVKFEFALGFSEFYLMQTVFIVKLCVKHVQKCEPDT